MVSLQVSGLTHEFDEREVFHSVDFDFGGACLAVCGSNGSGKSTLLRIIAGLLTPTSGSVRVVFDGRTAPPNALRGLVGLAAPDVHLYSELTSRENLQFLVDARSLCCGANLIASALDAVGLSHRADDRVGDLSSGLRRRACLAAAILHEPPLLLLDEPTANLDEEGARIVRALIESWSGRGMVVLATNDPSEAELGDARLDLSVLS